MANNGLLEFHPNTKEYVLKLFGLDRPGKLDQYVEIMDNWIKSQNYFTKKDYSRQYLVHALINAKGSVEKAKRKFESICVMRTLLPSYFSYTDIRKDFDDFLTPHCPGIFMPKLTPDHYRVLYMKISDHERFRDLNFLNLYMFINSILYEYLKLHDYCAGYITICDYRNLSITNLVAKINPVEFKNMVAIIFKSNNMVLKDLIFVSESKAIDALIKFVKPMLTEKIGKRISIYKDPQELHKKIPKEILPKELDGMDRSYKDIQEEWINTLINDEEDLKKILELQQARVDEKYKKLEISEYTELAGTFVSLQID